VGATRISANETAFVRRAGTRLSLDGKPYLFVGFNLFQANLTRPLANCSDTPANGAIDQQLRLMGPDVNVVRAWFFQSMATRGGRRRWSAFDRTLAAARRHGMRVIATLADQWNYCEGPYKDERWYAAGYKASVLPGDTVPYRRWVSEIVSRYKNNPTIAMWELTNEPEIQVSEADPSCPPDATVVLRRWAKDISSLIKTIDPRHLVSLGSGGNGGCGLRGAEYTAVNSLPMLDVCTYHDYWGAQLALSSDPNNGIQRRINECRGLKKPIYAGEVGVNVKEVSSLDERARLLAAKASAQFAAGISGFVVWDWRGSSNDDYEIGPADPVLSMLRAP
jgi:mannan endo-1,4-beta-mannosidase